LSQNIKEDDRNQEKNRANNGHGERRKIDEYERSKRFERVEQGDKGERGDRRHRDDSGRGGWENRGR